MRIKTVMATVLATLVFLGLAHGCNPNTVPLPAILGALAGGVVALAADRRRSERASQPARG